MKLTTGGILRRTRVTLVNAMHVGQDILESCGVYIDMIRAGALLSFLVPSLCAAQVTGSFSLDKNMFARGEPVFLKFTLTNSGDVPVDVVSADPYSFCSGYDIKITRQGTPRLACEKSYGGSCISGAVTVAPHASRTERILLNFQNTSRGEFNSAVSKPGDYTVEASRGFSYALPGQSIHTFEHPNHGDVHQIFNFSVDADAEDDQATYAPFVQQLTDENVEVRTEAARTLATLAPPAFEPLLLTFATSKDYVLKQFAPLALANLASEASHAALAEMLKNSQPGTYESMSAAQHLGETHDAKWMPVLLSVADKDGAMYLTYAAESGGEATIPELLSRLRSPDKYTREWAIDALGSTGSRAAIPLLIGLLRATPSGQEKGTDEALRAVGALQHLTGYYVRRDGAWLDEAHERWRRWWLFSGSNAPVYKPSDCVAHSELP